MLTIFSVPKAFRGATSQAQDNAIRSWRASNPDAEIVLCGDDEGIDHACVRNDVRHVPQLDKSEFGTPILSSAFSQVFALYPSELYLYVNCDIILVDDIVAITRKIPLESFLGVARRTTIDLEGRLDTDRGDWDERVRSLAKSVGVLDEPTAIDWFLMKGKGPWRKLPPFIVGRPHWDNWMVFAARKAGNAVVDCSKGIAVIHQSHGYGHVPRGVGGLWWGPEAHVNQRLVDAEGSFNLKGQVFSIAHATHRFDGGELRRNISLNRLRAEYRLAPNSIPSLSRVLYWLQDVHALLRGPRK